MLRVAAWTCGLFAVGGGVVHFFPGTFTEPLVLIVLGSTLLFVSGRPVAAAGVGAGAGADRAAPVSSTTRAAR